MKDITNKIIWITGASSGIGEALAIEFSKHNTSLILSARREEELHRVASLCSVNEAQIMILPINLEDHNDFEEKVNLVIHRFGKIDILFNIGGVSTRAFVKDTSMEVEKRIMNINYFGAIGLTKAVLPHMFLNNSGHIVVMSSIMGKLGSKKRSAYAASKHALHGYFDSLRAELDNLNIKVTIICPGYIKTQISMNALTGDGTEYKKMDTNQEKGMLPGVLAKKIVKAVQKERREVWIGGKEVLAIYIKRFFPGLLAKILSREEPK